MSTWIKQWRHGSLPVHAAAAVPGVSACARLPRGTVHVDDDSPVGMSQTRGLVLVGNADNVLRVNIQLCVFSSYAKCMLIINVCNNETT